jgi:glutamine synthetase
MSTAPKVYGPIGTVTPFLDHSITRHYLQAIPDQAGKVIAEYVWIGGTGQDVRSKTRTLSKLPEKPEDLPHWNFDGSSTGQAPGTDSEVYLIPRAIFKYGSMLAGTLNAS